MDAKRGHFADAAGVQPALNLLRLGATGEGFGSPVFFVAFIAGWKSTGGSKQPPAAPGVLGFMAWASMYYVHPAVGRAADTNPELRPWIFAGIGLLPLLGWVILALGWGKPPQSPAVRHASAG